MENLHRMRVGCLCCTVGFLTCSGALMAQTPANDASLGDQTQVGAVDGPLRWTSKLLPIPRATSGGVEAAVLSDRSIYLAGRWWNKEDRANLWLWRLDSTGEKLWGKQLECQKKDHTVAVIGMLPNARKYSGSGFVPGVRVVISDGLETRLVFFKANGDVAFKQTIGQLENAMGVIPDQDDGMILYGRSMVVRGKPSYGWVARVTRLGTLLWKRTYHANATVDQEGAVDNSDSEETVPRGFLRQTHLLDAVSLDDGSIVLVGQFGVYNKFGQGDSTLWLLRIDRDGNKLAEAFVDQGRLYPKGRDLITRCGEGVVVAYTMDQLPPIGAALCNREMAGFSVFVVRFDDQLQQVWDTHLYGSLMPGAAAIGGPEPLVGFVVAGDQLLVRGINREGKEHWASRATVPEGFVTPLGILRHGDDVVAICNHRETNRDAYAYAQSALLVFGEKQQAR